jgi:hypothetical protein
MGIEMPSGDQKPAEPTQRGSHDNPSLYTHFGPHRCQGTKPLQIDRPGRDQTCDLGIKSPAEEAAAKCKKLKQPAKRTGARCSELQRTVPCGDKRLRAFLRAIAA